MEDCDEDALEAHDDDVTDCIEAYVAAESAEDVEESVEEEYEAALCRVISVPCVVWPESCAGLEPAPLTRGVHGSAAARSSLRPATRQPQFAVISGLTLLIESRLASSEVVSRLHC